MGTSPVLFSSPESVSVIARIRDTLDLLVQNCGLAARVCEERIFLLPKSWTPMSTLFYTQKLRRAITDTDLGDEKRTGEVPTLIESLQDQSCLVL